LVDLRVPCAGILAIPVLKVMSFATLRSRYAFVCQAPGYKRSLAWGSLLLVVGPSSVLFVKPYILAFAGGAAPSPDLILDHIPAISTYGVAVFGPAVIALVLACHLLAMPWYAPVVWKSVGLLYLLRAGFIVLTPLGIPGDQFHTLATTLLQSITYSGNDFFFSGHVAFPFLLALAFWQHAFIRSIYLVLTCVMAAAVLLEHVHYSIDVAGAPFIVYGLWAACKKYCPADMDVVASAEVRFSR
jgi:hypothetical protein